MDILREGDSGPEVITLQNRLKEHGFPPGAIDGRFGPGTEAALMAFQQSEGLPADGVFGMRTAAAMGFAPAVLPPQPGLPKGLITVDVVSKMFPRTHLDNISANLPHVLAALEESKLAYVPMVLVALGTIRAETEGFVPIDEGKSKYNTSPGGRPFDLYDNRKNLGNRGPTDGADFKGRGYIQLTGRANYTKFGPIVGTDLVAHPDQANDPAIAGKILAAFLAATEVAIRAALQEGDLRAARRLVNGGSNGLDRFTEAYEIGLKLLT